MRKVAILDDCSFARNAMNHLVNESVDMTCSLMTDDCSVLLTAFKAGIPMNDIVTYVKPGGFDIVKVLNILMRSASPPRIISMVDDGDILMLRLLHAIGGNFIVSRQGAVNELHNILQCHLLSHYISYKLQLAIQKHPPHPLRLTESMTLDGAQILTATESEILIDLLQGKSTKLVARKRLISEKTISTHKLNALRKLRLKNLNAFFI
uniref:Transcriptional regulator FimZ n=1 Tax=Serratia marcescens TaxID=615 RepID=A0A1C3HI21_SERMA|nr:transcriptional regulator FimZ [Serratia marcescens]